MSAGSRAVGPDHGSHHNQATLGEFGYGAIGGGRAWLALPFLDSSTQCNKVIVWKTDFFIEILSQYVRLLKQLTIRAKFEATAVAIY
jgi:hypothetical protein